MSDIITQNQLVEQNGLFVLAQGAPDFAYSDGEKSEQYLHEVYSSVADLSSHSHALQEKIIDWPSEYHFSHKRANLLRGLDLSTCKRVLELGSGCGAISRYLGEQGLQVDAIEGSAVRAKLGRMRCHDLPNVNIINANYNDLTIPKDYYDLVLFVGVIEYASMFYPQADNDYAAAKQILTQAHHWIQSSGAVLVAIENRLGLKYMLGQHEDHYHKRYIGIDNYRDSAGMATYSRKQWQQLAKQAGFSHTHCLLPFPDYKVPEVVLSEDYVKQNANAYNHLEGVFARDYSGINERLVTEPISWQSAAQGGFLSDISNSFCLLLGNDADVLRKLGQLDFYHGPVMSRQPQFVVDTLKKAGEDKVIKRHVFNDTLKADETDVSQDLAEQSFLQGDLLSTRWFRTILIYNNIEPLNQCIVQYYQFLQTRDAQQLTIDLLPNNIIVDELGNWQVFDQEWQVASRLSPGFVLFRALLNFIIRHWFLVRNFLAIYQMHTVKDFVRHGLAVNGILIEDVLSDFVEQETTFQNQVGHDTNVNALLEQVFELKQANFATAQLTIVSQNAQNERQLEQLYQPQQGRTVLQFNLPSKLEKIDVLRFAPFDLRHQGDIGFFQIQQMKLRKRFVDAENALLDIDAHEFVERARAVNAVYNAEQDFWSAQNDYPWFELSLESLSLDRNSQYQIEITLSFMESSYYAAARTQFIAQNQSLLTDVHNLRQQVQGEKQARTEMQKQLQKQLEAQVQNAQQEIEIRDAKLEELRNLFLVKVARKLKNMIRFAR